MEKTLKVLMIGSDRKLFDEESAILERMKEYGSLVKELHIIVFARKSLGFKDKKIGSNIYIYPTNSITRWLYPLDAIRIGKKIKASIITTQDPFESGWAGLKLKKILHIPLEVQLHTNPLSPYFTGFLNTIRKIIARRVLAQADGVRNVLDLPIYVDRKRIDGELKFDLHEKYGFKTVLLMVTRLAPEKNIGLAIKTLKLVRKKFPDTGLVIVGSGPEEKYLKLLVKRLKLEDAVAFVGWQNDLASFYKTADVFIQTSLFEGYGLSLVEAGLSGLPVITTPVGIAQELERNKDAYIYPHNHPELFAQGIIDLIENNHKRENLKVNLKKTLESKLLSKADYMAQIKDNWEKTAVCIK